MLSLRIPQPLNTTEEHLLSRPTAKAKATASDGRALAQRGGGGLVAAPIAPGNNTAVTAPALTHHAAARGRPGRELSPHPDL